MPPYYHIWSSWLLRSVNLANFFWSSGLKQWYQHPQPVACFQRHCERAATADRIQSQWAAIQYRLLPHWRDIPDWLTFISSPPHVTDLKIARFKAMQESTCKESKELSVYSKCDGKLSEVHHDSDTTIICQILCMLALSCYVSYVWKDWKKTRRSLDLCYFSVVEMEKLSLVRWQRVRF